MLLVNEGLPDLDWSVRDVLPEFRLADKSSVRPLGGRDEHGRVGWLHWSRAAVRI